MQHLYDAVVQPGLVHYTLLVLFWLVSGYLLRHYNVKLPFLPDPNSSVPLPSQADLAGIAKALPVGLPATDPVIDATHTATQMAIDHPDQRTALLPIIGALAAKAAGELPKAS